MSRAFLPLMPENSRIVNVSSVASHLRSFDPQLADRFRSCESISDVDKLANEFERSCERGMQKKDGWPDSYCTSKACMNALTRVMARENPKVLVNCCCPGTSLSFPSTSGIRLSADRRYCQGGVARIWECWSETLPRLVVGQISADMEHLH